MFCSNCGTENKVTDNFCNKCGKTILEDSNAEVTKKLPPELNTKKKNNMKKVALTFLCLMLFVLFVPYGSVKMMNGSVESGSFGTEKITFLLIPLIVFSIVLIAIEKYLAAFLFCVGLNLIIVGGNIILLYASTLEEYANLTINFKFVFYSIILALASTYTSFKLYKAQTSN
jgi:hypothetical protein